MSDKPAIAGWKPEGPIAPLMAELRAARSGRPIDRDIALLAGEVTVAEEWAKKPIDELLAAMAAAHLQRDATLQEALELGNKLQKVEESRAYANRSIRVLAQAVALKAGAKGQ